MLAAVFKETNNRMLAGYLLRDVVNMVNKINFASSGDIHLQLVIRQLKDGGRCGIVVPHSVCGWPVPNVGDQR